MLLQLTVGLACLLAFILQLAVYRSPDVVDNAVKTSARRITVVAMLVAGVYVLYTSLGAQTMETPLCLVIGLLALGQCLFAVHNLLPAFEKVHPKWNSHSTSSQ